MANKKRIIYWDSCIFLAWIFNEQNEAAIMDGIEEIVKQVDQNKLTLITSVVTRTEVLEGKMDDIAKMRFDDLFKRRNVVMISLDHRISDLSHDIRNYYDIRGDKLSTPDCQHIATAILYEANELHTLDGSGKKKKGKILPLSGNILGKHPLKICTPYSDQPSLFSGIE